MERKHKVYFIISGIAYLLLHFTFKLAYFKIYPFHAYQIYSYSLLFILAIAFIFGIRNSIRGIVVWLGIICGDLLHIIEYIYFVSGQGFVSVNVVYFSLIIVAIVFGFMSLNINTIALDNFLKMYRKPAIVFFVCLILFYVLISISGMEFIWFSKSSTSLKTLGMLKYLVSLVIVISALGFAISKIVKRKTFGFLFSAVLLVWYFFFCISLIFSGSMLSYSAFLFQYKFDAIRSSPILYFIPMIFLKYGLYIFVFLVSFSLILLINFLFYLKRDPGLIPNRSNDVKPSSGVTK